MQKMMQASAREIAAAKALYRAAIDAQAKDGEGEAWWSDVAVELVEVISAPSIAAAASVIAWWHHDWTCVSDTPQAAASRIRHAARAHRAKRAVLLAGRLAEMIGGRIGPEGDPDEAHC